MRRMQTTRPDSQSSDVSPDAVRPPQVTWDARTIAASLPPDRLDLPCPNCGAARCKTPVVAVDFITPDHPMRRSHVLRCPDCTCCFFDDQNPPDYAEEAMLERGRVPFYIQQGAGLWLITRPLGQVRKPPGSRYTEVGCGFGFGLDYAIRAKGWHAAGLDPAGLSRLGREALGVPIESRYFSEDAEAAGSMDVVMGSELIEHVPAPRAFVAALRRMLRPDGVLILTTPNAEHIAPATSPGVLVPLLSPGLHLTLHTPASLRRLLQEAGFRHAQVEADSHSLLAFASDAELDLETDPGQLRAAYLSHLARRSIELDPASDVFLGYAGRALFECVNAGELTGARTAWDRLVPACRARFGLQLDGITALPPEADSCGLDELAQLMPLNLCAILYAGAMLDLLHGVPRGEMERAFSLAAQAADTLRGALGQLAMADGLTEDIAWTATAEAILCAAAAGDPEAATRMAALPPCPVDAARRSGFVQRVLTTLVNAGQYAAAHALATAEALLGGADSDVDAASVAGDIARDAMFSLGVLDVQPDGDPARARRRFASARYGLGHDHHLFWPTVQGELLALCGMGREAEATELAREMVRLVPDSATVPDDVRARAAVGPD